MATTLPEPALEELTLEQVFDPLRRRVVASLAELPDQEERSCASFGFLVSKASLTPHFKVLREAGLIRQVDYGNRRCGSLRRKDIDARFPSLLAMVVADARRRAP